MGILAVLTAVATSQLIGYLGKAKTQSAQLKIENIGTALELYYMENGSYPSASVGRKALVEATPEVERSLSEESQESAGPVGTSLPIQLSWFERRV